jgi:lipopolysaccharide export system protein LptC
MSSRIKSGKASAAEVLARRAAWRVKLARALGFGALLLGLGIFGAFLFQSGFFSNFASQPKKVEDIVANPDVISGTESRISGVDKDNQPFEISAVKGVQDKATTSLVHLETVTGVFHRGDDKRINLASDTALYDTKTKAMAMSGNVVFEDPGRYKAQMEKANVNLDDVSLISQSPVHVDMETGSVDADSLEIMDNGRRSLFKGHVKARIKADAEEDSGKGDAQ